MGLLAKLRELTGHLRRTRVLRRRVGRGVPGGYVETVEVFPAGLVRVRGWSDQDAPPALELRCGGEPLAAERELRLYRPDIAWIQGATDAFRGYAREAVLPSDRRPAAALELLAEGRCLLRLPLPEPESTPGASWLAEPRPLQRDHVYTDGPPVHAVSPEVLALVTATVDGPVLDFGCGAGALVRSLRAAGHDVQGIELDRPAVRERLLPEAAPHVQLYPGELPLPFADGEFAWATAIEVLEHLPNPDAFLAELARVTRRGVVLTVPDMSALALGGPEKAVPWHLLEDTHVNFFTAPSLAESLGAHFARVRLAAVHELRFTDAGYFESLGAIGEH